MKKQLIALALSLSILTYNSITSVAAPENSNPVETNEIPNWPVGPTINSEAAFLLEANTGVVLYSKNMNKHLYPASTTKIMTVLLASENSKRDDIVKFSYDAVFSLDPGSSNIGIDPGQAMPMEECMYGIMVGSANEVSNAVAEHVGGSIEGFVEMMNQRASDLGLKDTHFMNANGLPNKEHYTSAHDLAYIAKEYFSNEYISKIGNTPNHHFIATSTQPDDFYIRNKHKLINGDIKYEGIKGGKTGYTTEANETLVTCAERDGMKLICVVLNADSPYQFTDTVELFDYGFNNFQVSNLSANEVRYSIKSNNIFPTSVDILGNSRQILDLNSSDYIIMPKNITFDDVETKVTFDSSDENTVAKIEYSYHGAYLGYGNINRVTKSKNVSAFDASLSQVEEEKKVNENEPIFINIIDVANYIVIIAFGLILISFIISFLINYNLLDNIKSKNRIRKRRRSSRGSGNLKF